MNKKLRFKGLSIEKKDFEQRFLIELSDQQWTNLISYTTRSWEEGIEELRLMVFRHIRTGMNELGYNPELSGKEIKFKKK